MRQVKVGPEGIRGRVGKGLDMVQLIDLASAYATWIENGPVLIARDTRSSSPMLARAVRAALSAAGCEVLDAGICPTAVGQFEAANRGLAGAITITGAHNDGSWNGLKLFGPAGQILSSAEGREILDIWRQEDFRRARHDELGVVSNLDDPFSNYLARFDDWVDIDEIARADLRVIVDACNGSGAVIVSALCAKLGVELIPVSCEPTGLFPHPPDPTVPNLAQVAAITRPVEAAVGFGLGSDCERVALVTNEGCALGREATLALVVDHLLRTGAPADAAVVAGVNCDSRVIEVAKKHGARVVRCGVGTLAVAERVLLEDAVAGGDNSGGVLVPSLHPAFDGLAMMALLLEAVAQAGNARTLADRLPQVHSLVAVVPCPMSRAYSAVGRIRDRAEGRVSELDGVLVELAEGWYHVRVAHTEPVIRITCEAETKELAHELVTNVRAEVRSALEGWSPA